MLTRDVHNQRPVRPPQPCPVFMSRPGLAVNPNGRCSWYRSCASHTSRSRPTYWRHSVPAKSGPRATRTASGTGTSINCSTICGSESGLHVNHLPRRRASGTPSASPPSAAQEHREPAPQRSVNNRAMTSHEMETRSFYMTQAGPLEVNTKWQHDLSRRAKIYTTFTNTSVQRDIHLRWCISATHATLPKMVHICNTCNAPHIQICTP